MLYAVPLMYAAPHAAIRGGWDRRGSRFRNALGDPFRWERDQGPRVGLPGRGFGLPYVKVRRPLARVPA